MKIYLIKLFFTALFAIFSTNILCNYLTKEMNENNKITKYDELLSLNGEKVCILGKYVKYNLMPEMESDYILYLSGILMEGDTIPNLFLQQPRSEEERDDLNGQKVEVTGIFYIEQPAFGRDPETVARILGSWIYDIESLKVIQE